MLYFALCTFKIFDFVFTEDQPSVSQSNVQAVTAENEEQYTCNIIYIKFQNCCLFFFRSTLKEVLLKYSQIN